jgi:hypothetical protein
VGVRAARVQLVCFLDGHAINVIRVDLGIKAFQQQDFISRHPRHIEPAMIGVVFH